MNNAFSIFLFLVASFCFSVKATYGSKTAPSQYRLKTTKELHTLRAPREAFYNPSYDSEPETGEVSRKEFKVVERSIQNINSRLNNLDDGFNELEVLIKRNGQQFDELKFTLQLFIDKDFDKYQEDDDCVTKCIQDSSCTSVFWTNTSSSNCTIKRNKNTMIQFTKGQHFYCKDCETTTNLVYEGEGSGIIRLLNVAINKSVQASPYLFGNEPSMAVDGKLSTQFCSDSLAETKDEAWLMVDLGERHLVAQIIIEVVNTPLKKRRGGSFKVCLVDDFDPKINPCNKDTEILVVANRLRSSNIVFDVTRVIKGRYVFLQKINRKDILEIVEIYIIAVFPVVPYLCERCNKKENTVCDASASVPTCQCSDSKLFPINGDTINGCTDLCGRCNKKENTVCDTSTGIPTCKCNDSKLFPINGNAINGCTNPCKGFNDENSVCLPIDFERKSCSCKKGNFYPIDNDACKGCQDPCHRFSAKNTECISVTFNSINCKCETNYSPIVLEDPCQGCKLIDSCAEFSKENAICIEGDCSCKEGPFYPVGGDPCNGCKDPCEGFNENNSVCISIDFERKSCSCNKGNFYPIENDACKGCQDPCNTFSAKNTECVPVNYDSFNCKCEINYSPIVLGDPCEGCELKETCKGFFKENSVCTEIYPGQKKCSCVEGSFFPIDEDPCNGCKDPCHRFSAKNTECIPVNVNSFNCKCDDNYSPIVLGDPCQGCKLNDQCDGFCKENSVCTRGDSGEKKNCSCNEGSFYPVDGDPCNGCKDPCSGFRAKNSKCIPIDFKNYDCECEENYSPVILDDPCFGCKLNDPCDGFCKENSVCSRGDSGEKKNCSCNEGSFPVGGDPCNGCKDPCSDFRAKNSACVPTDFKNYDCECEENYSPLILDNPCFGCKLNDPCDGFCKENSVCSRGDSGEKKNCTCNEGSFYPVGGDPCNGCKDPCSGFRAKNTKCVPTDFLNYNCECEENHFPAILDDPCLGCKLNDKCTDFSKENAICIEGYCFCKKGPFYPIGGNPCNGCKDPCRGFDSNNTICVSIDSENHNCRCKDNYAPIDVNDICLGCVQEKACTKSGEISSPNYPKNYPKDSKKNWKVVTGSNCQIHMKFLAFSLEEGFGGKCKYDSLTIREGPSSTSPILKTICANETQTEIWSTNHAFYLQFRSSFFSHFPGFHIIWKEVPV